MADYFPVLSRAVAGLETNTGEARRLVYDRARAAIVRQLRAIDPPLAEEDISRERMQLEEAIRKVEAGAGGAAATPQAPAPATGGGSQRPKPPKAAPQPSSPAPREDARAQSLDPKGSSRGPAQARPATRADGRPIIRSAGDGAVSSKPKRSVPLVALAALALIGIGVGLFAARGQIASMLGGGSGAQTVATAPTQGKSPAETSSETTAKSDESAAKSDDRLPQGGQAATEPAPAASEPAPPPPAEPEIAKASEAAAQAPSTPPIETAPQPTAPALVAQRAVLYEEGPNQQSGEALQGSIVWRLESVSGGQGQPLETALRGDVDIPSRKLRATITIRRNADATLPASHTIEIQFTLPDDFPNAGISNVPGVLMKADESARGAAVSGLSVRVTNGFFLIGLSNLETERSVNEQLLRDRGWIDIPILYNNGRRAVLTLEKGTPGTQAFQEAFTTWRSSTSAAGAGR